MRIKKGSRVKFSWNHFPYANGFKGVVYGVISSVRKGLYTINWEDKTTTVVERDWIEEYCGKVVTQ